MFVWCNGGGGGNKFVHPTIQTSVKFRDLRSHIFHKALSNVAINFSGIDGFSLICPCQKLKKKNAASSLFFHRMPRQADQHFDDILRYVGEFGLWQKFLYFSSCFLVIVSSAIQIASLVFATGTPKFHCTTPNVTCDENKCCAECTSYAFDQSFTSTVTEVRIGFISCFVTVISGLDLETRRTSSVLNTSFPW